MKVDTADEAFARAGELNPRLDLTVVAQASDVDNAVDFDARFYVEPFCLRIAFFCEVPCVIDADTLEPAGVCLV